MPEIESLAEFDRVVARAHDLHHLQVQDLDLTDRVDVLDRLDPRGALFLGCTIPADAEQRLRQRGALVFPRVPDVPVDPYRSTLYTPAELYDDLGEGYPATLDARVYHWWRESPGLRSLLVQALHDQAIDDALAEYVDARGGPRRVVGVMGGHATQRGEASYRQAAQLGHRLAGAGLTVATGGGPGAMEAANLGARLADADRAELDAVVDRLAAVPRFDAGATPGEGITAWARAAREQASAYDDSGLSLGVPTWFYGHEPPNAFASVHAKYFRNAIREDVLLEQCGAGLVFLPGAGGTVQEIFQAACRGYYAAAGRATTLVLLGRDYWTEQLPAWPLLRALGVAGAAGTLAARLRLLDDPEEVAGVLVEEL